MGDAPQSITLRTLEEGPPSSQGVTSPSTHDVTSTSTSTTIVPGPPVTPSLCAKRTRSHLFAAFLTLLTPIPYVLIGYFTWLSFPPDPASVIDRLWIGYGLVTAIVSFSLTATVSFLEGCFYSYFVPYISTDAIRTRQSVHLSSIIDNTVRLAAIHLLWDARNFHHAYSFGIGWVAYGTFFVLWVELSSMYAWTSPSASTHRKRTAMCGIELKGVTMATWWSQQIRVLTMHAGNIACCLFFTVSPFFLLLVMVYVVASELDSRVFLKRPHGLVWSATIYIVLDGGLFVGALALVGRL